MAHVDGPLLASAVPTRPDDALAALRERRYPRRSEQPRRLRLDTGLTLEIPAPRVLARVWAIPHLAAEHDVFREGAALLRRPRGTTDAPRPLGLPHVAEELRERLATLPDRSDAGRPYADARLFALAAEPHTMRAYLYETAQAVRTASPRWRPPSTRAKRQGPPLTVAERQRKSRAARHAREVENAEHWLRLWHAEAEPGTRIAARELYGEAASALGEFVEQHAWNPEEYAEEAAVDGWPTVPVVPGVKVFYEAADAVIAPRSRTAAGYVYTVPATAPAEALLDEIARVALADVAPAIGAYLTSKYTSTDAERQAAA